MHADNKYLTCMQTINVYMNNFYYDLLAPSLLLVQAGVKHGQPEQRIIPAKVMMKWNVDSRLVNNESQDSLL